MELQTPSRNFNRMVILLVYLLDSDGIVGACQGMRRTLTKRRNRAAPNPNPTALELYQRPRPILGRSALGGGEPTVLKQTWLT